MLKLCELAMFPLIILCGGLLESFFRAPRTVHGRILYDDSHLYGDCNKRIAPQMLAHHTRHCKEYLCKEIIPHEKPNRTEKHSTP